VATKPAPEAAVIKAFYISNSERDEILGRKLNLLGVLPSALENTAIAFSMGNFAQAADASAEEIAKARDDARNTFQIGLSLYEAFEWIYGPEAFGLRFAAWFARKAPDAVIDGLVLGCCGFARFQMPSCLPSMPKWQNKRKMCASLPSDWSTYGSHGNGSRRTMRRCRGLFRLSGAFCRRQFSADYIITMFGFDFRQEQASVRRIVRPACRRATRSRARRLCRRWPADASRRG
jgi:hypothetical protein